MFLWMQHLGLKGHGLWRCDICQIYQKKIQKISEFTERENICKYREMPNTHKEKHPQRHTHTHTSETPAVLSVSRIKTPSYRPAAAACVRAL